MDTRTGEIHNGPSFGDIIKKLKLEKHEAEAFLQLIEESDMTPKQAVERTVSQFDHRTKLGILRNKRIKAIGRNNPCPCGSGKNLFKECQFPVTKNLIESSQWTTI